MEFIISRNILLNALTKVRNFIDKRANFKDFVFIFDEDNASSVTIHAVSSTNEHIAIRVPLEAPAVSPRTIAVFYADLLRPLKTLEDQPLRFDVSEYQIKVFHSLGSFRIRIDDFDCSVLDKYTYDIDLSKKGCYHLEYEVPGLRSVLKRCNFAMAQDELRPVMNGVCFNYTPEYSDYVSSDGHKLVRVRKSAIIKANISFVIPYSTVKHLLRMLPSTGDVELDIMIEDEYVSYVRLVIDDYITLYFKPVEGRYPNYRSVIPEYHYFEMAIDRRLLIKSVDRLTLFASDSELLTMTINTSSVRLNTSDVDFSTDGEETLPCEAKKTDGYEIDGFFVGVKGSDLSSTLKALPYENVVFRFVDKSRAILILPQPQPDFEDITMIIMPMLIND